jgi:hypothetical protein
MLFRKKKSDTPVSPIPQEVRTKVEVVAHQEATKQQIDEVKQINQMLNKQFVENGFTIKIFIAAGGRDKK